MWLVACQPVETDSVADPGEAECAPSCVGKTCGSDGCGGSCGVCDEEPTVEDPGCVPDCAGKTCEDPNGCGAACGPCANLQNCAACALKLSVVGREVADGFVRRVTLALDYQPSADITAHPGLVDLRFKVDGPGALARVGMGAPVLDAGKRLIPDPVTGRHFQEFEDGTYQILLAHGADRIEAGRWLYLEFELGEAGGPAHTPLIVTLVSREETFAPVAADTQLWTQTDLSTPVVVWANEVTDAP